MVPSPHLYKLMRFRIPAVWIPETFGSKVGHQHTELERSTPSNLYQRAIKPGFLSWLALPGDCRLGVRYRGVARNFLGFAEDSDYT